MGVGAISLLCGRFGLLHRGVWVVVHLHALPLITSASLLYLLRRELQEVSFFKRADEDIGPFCPSYGRPMCPPVGVKSSVSPSASQLLF